MRWKPRSRQRDSSVLNGMRTRCAPDVGVQPRVVALGLHPADGVPGHQVGDAAQFGGHDVGSVVAGLVAVAAGLGGRGEDPADRLVEPALADGLEQVVDGADVERLHGLVVVRRHEHHRGAVGEVGQHAGQFEPAEAGHVDVEEHRVDGAPVEFPQRRGRVAGREAPRPMSGCSPSR